MCHVVTWSRAKLPTQRRAVRSVRLLQPRQVPTEHHPPGSSAWCQFLQSRSICAESSIFLLMTWRPLVSIKLKHLLCRAWAVPSPSHLHSLLLCVWVVVGRMDKPVPGQEQSLGAVTMSKVTAFHSLQLASSCRCLKPGPWMETSSGSSAVLCGQQAEHLLGFS